ncbi:hypothetical protein KZC51_12895 [Microbacterium sp. SSW1-49]|uniref:Aminoacyl-transfer RNA synthetases class-II family profile domain-containing protein n=1 Tax=Microbacterium croceum TaxID=2851645 RepID=A0ABT0FG29_9MICO|nr:amino acid--tRNA ligase-related protein [Microbacterium croceum]MCK2037029.1 hypothetical protein [Microbacterium croceum]
MSSVREINEFVVEPDRFLKILDDPRTRLLVELQDLVLQESAGFWAAKGAKNLHLPITTNTISSPMGLGSDSLPVKVSMFGVDTYLADSMQFMLEYGCRLAPEGAWYLMPSFRGEDADETHLNQFFHSEAEILGDLGDVMALSEEYVRALASAALERLSDQLNEHAGGTAHLEAMVRSAPFTRLTLDEAVAHLGDDGQSVRHDEGGWRVLTRFGERRLMNEIDPFVWVTHFDHLSVPFYQAYGDDEKRTSLNGDLLFGIGEVVGCGERHVTGAQAREALVHHEVPEDDYAWYLQMKDHSPLQTAGFGLGVERWLMWALAHDDIRELQLVPRFNGQVLAP